MKTMLALILAVAGLSHVSAQSSQAGNAAEVQAYLNKVQRGEAGVNPQDQSAARRGDPYAQARIQQRLATNAITAQQNGGTLTASEATARRIAADATYQRQILAIDQQREQQRILAEIRRQNDELQRLRQAIEAENRVRLHQTR